MGYCGGSGGAAGTVSWLHHCMLHARFPEDIFTFSVCAVFGCCVAALRCCAFPTCWVMIKAPVLAVPGAWLAQRTSKCQRIGGFSTSCSRQVAALAALAALAASWVLVEGQWRPRAGSQGDHRAGAQPYPGRIGTALPSGKQNETVLIVACGLHALSASTTFLGKGASQARLQLKLTLGAGRSFEFADGTFRRDLEVLRG